MPTPTDLTLTADWPAPPGIIAGCTTRAGGVSHGAYATLNLGDHVDDEPRSVATNRQRFRAALGQARPPLWLNQVHGPRIVAADALGHDAHPSADGAWSRGERCLVIQTADCLPVLIAARDGAVFAAVHAGWRGLAAGVIEAALAALDRPGAELVAWFGPHIFAAQYEVDELVRRAFIDRDSRYGAAFSATRPGHFHCDLSAIARAILVAGGCNDIYASDYCTYNHAALFYSFRRDGVTGRQVSFIYRA